MVGVATGNYRVTAHCGPELKTRKKGSLDTAAYLDTMLTMLSDSKAEEGLVTALSRIEALFLSFHTGESRAAPGIKEICGALLSDVENKEKVHWAREDAYPSFIRALLQFLVRPQVPSALQSRAVNVLMEFVRSEVSGAFNNALYLRLCSTLVGSKGSISNIVGILESQYFQYADVRYFSYLNAHKLAVGRSAMHEDSRSAPSLQMFVRNLYELLSRLPTTLGEGTDDTTTTEKRWCRGQSVTSDSLNADMNSKMHGIYRCDDIVLQKEAFLKSWRAFVRLSQPLQKLSHPVSLMNKNFRESFSRVLATSLSTDIAAPDSFLSSLVADDDEVDERLKQLAACKSSTSDKALVEVPSKDCNVRDLGTADWLVNARGKDDDDDDDDNDEEDNEDDEEEEEEEEEEDDDDEKDEEDDVEGGDEEEEADGEGEADGDGEADDNGEGEDEEGDEEDEDDDEDEDEPGEEDDDEEDEHDDKEEDDDEAEGESEEDVEPPKKKRK